MVPAQLRSDVSDADLNRLASLHREAIDGGFLSSLGDRFLRRLYRSLCRSRHASVWAVRDGREIIGFIAGSTSTRAVYRDFAWSAGPSVVVTLLPKLLSWRRVRRLAETALYPSRKQEANGNEAEVLNFCVDAEARGSGVGRKLFAALADDFRDRGIDCLGIVTGAEQHSAQRFYESAGARFVGKTEVHKDEESLKYVYDLHSSTHCNAA